MEIFIDGVNLPYIRNSYWGTYYGNSAGPATKEYIMKMKPYNRITNAKGETVQLSRFSFVSTWILMYVLRIKYAHL